MHRLSSHKKKYSALFFLILFSVETFYPSISYAITSGPSQPEMQKFEPAGTNDMVDLFTGDFKYNIPLLDVGGYPVNLAYQSGTGMEDEATWVGTGWSLNPGAVTRTMRGLPDDFDGSKGDKVKKEYYRKEFKKVGGKVVLKGSLFGREIGNASVSMNIYKDNYYGIGASIGASIGFDLAKNTSGTLTAGLGLDINSDVRDGASITPNLSLSGSSQIGANNNSGSLSGGFSYNTRAGLKSVDLGLSFTTTNPEKKSASLSSSAVHYFGQTYTPTIQNNINNDQKSLNFDIGPTGFGTYGGIGGGGYYYHESIVDNKVSVPAYGYMNYNSGRLSDNALLDFNREKDGVYIPGMPSIATPVATPDFFMATGQAGSQQFRSFYSGNYVVFDKTHTNKSSQGGLGLTVGVGNILQVGGRVDIVGGKTETKKWTGANGNGYLSKADAQFDNSPDAEPVYFKQTGEHTKMDQTYYNLLGERITEKVVLSGSNSTTSFKSRESNNPANSSFGPMNRTRRDIRSFGFSYLNGNMASKYALDKQIKSYDYTNISSPTGISNRVDADKKGHHISEITVTGNDGQRMVYGIPVYNKKQVDVSFSVEAENRDINTIRRNGLIDYTTNDVSESNGKGRDHLYTAESTPGYATSYLLTGVLSQDYVDLTGDGITDDDLGTAVNFKYKKGSDYKWRAPYGLNTANYNEGYLSDLKDDKANYSYGEKEIWNLASIESKTMIAIFRTSPREDGLGVYDEKGGASTDGAARLMKLDQIELYSKADWLSAIHNSNITPIPIKVVHFAYDYSLYPGMPNNLASGTDRGKLTLKKVYFTFGKNNRGVTNPYEFDYDMRPIRDLNNEIPAPTSTYNNEYNDNYTQRQSDRWGTYKQSWYVNLLGGTSTATCAPYNTYPLNNSEFPYALQKNMPPRSLETHKPAWSDLIDRMASKWQLTSITTPASGRIEVKYESDDYAYVQNRRAMQMCFINGIGSLNSSQGLATTQDIFVHLPIAPSSLQDFQKKYLDGQDKIFYKFFVDMDGRCHYDYVHGYASIDINNCEILSDNNVRVRLIKLNGYNPIAKGAWQTLKSDLPQYAYDNYDNSEVGDITAAIKSLITAFTNLREFFIPFDQHAAKSGFANKVDLSKSMIRLCCPDMKKTGGGSRVKSLKISDEWASMTQTQSTGSLPSASYGQLYDYTIKDKDGNFVSSSGVAAYEPQIGNEENPFHEPVNYTEKVYWSSDRNHFVEKPYCESYFPAASVGYSKVTVTSTGNNNTGETGYIENEFYTAKDFPTIVDNLPLDQNKYQNSLIIQLFASTSIQRMAVSQGFKVELNDMHGKPKSIKVHNQAKDIISQTDYFYSVDDDNAEVKQLNNKVDILQQDGTILPTTTIGVDADFVSDVRESTSEQIGTSVGGYAGVTIIPFPPLIFFLIVPYGGVNFNASVSSNTYRSVCAVKVIHQSGILKKVRTMQNGSTLTTENLLWDGETGDVLLTKVQNEFDDYTYSFNYPAYMAYDGMGSAYKNIGTLMNNFYSNASGVINSAFSSYLFPGDELVAVNGNLKGWVIKPNDGILRLIDESGRYLGVSGSFMNIRSGRRNLLTASAGSIVLMNDPREGNKLNLSVDKKLLDSKAVLYNEMWNIPTDTCLTCPPGYALSPEGQCVKNIPTIDERIQVCAANPYYAYSACGSYIYGQFDPSLSNFTRRRISPSNPFWIGTPSAQSQQCNYTPVLTMGTVAQPRNSQLNSNSTSIDYDSLAARNGMRAQSQNENTNLSVTEKGPLNRCGIWTCPTGSSYPVGRWIGFSKTLTITSAKYYYVGIAADDRFRVKVDGQLVAQRLIDDGENYRIWHIFPVFLSAGERVIEIEGWNSGSQASFGAEIYNNTETEIENASSYSQLNLLFSTANMRGQYFQTGVNSCPVGYTLNTTTTPNSCSSMSPQLDPTNSNILINPYHEGVLGNWRPQANFVYTVNRTQPAGLSAQQNGTDIRRSGSYSTYTPFWGYSAGKLRILQFTQDMSSFDLQPPADKRWVWANQSIYFDQKGNEIESRDALYRYGAAIFGYDQSIAIATGANTRHNELAFDGFEDYNFNLGNPNSCIKRQLNWGFYNTGINWKSDYGEISKERVHTGKYAYKFDQSFTLKCNAGKSAPSSFLNFTAANGYQLTPNEQNAGLALIPQKKYVLSFWVSENEDHPSNTVKNLNVLINGSTQGLALNARPTYVVEGWKKVEIVFSTPSNISGNNLALQFVPNGIVYLDDIRILPFDGQLNSYVYDPVSMRLMAQLDENNFATLYEYDDEGTLIRVKKETEKGIVTLKENRQSLRKR